MSALAGFQARFMDGLFAAEAQAPAGLAIYRRNALATLEGALTVAYPAVSRLAGEAFFREAARRYARAEPSRCGDLHAYGGGFGEFLAACAPAARLAWLPEVARLEWAVHECFHADDAASLAFDRLGALDPAQHERLRLHLHPAVRLVASRHPVHAIWEANQPGRDGTPERIRGRDHVLVRREERRVIVERLDAREWRFLARIAGGATLATACDAFGAAVGRRLAPALARHARAGLFAGFDVSPAP